MRRMSLSLLCVLSVCLLAMSMADPFESTKWNVKVTPDEEARGAGAKDFDEVLSFKGGQFAAIQYMAKKGFKPSTYEDDVRRMGPAGFTAEIKSDTDGTAKWSGIVTAAAIRGDLKWTKKDGTEMNFTYTGERAPVR